MSGPSSSPSSEQVDYLCASLSLELLSSMVKVMNGRFVDACITLMDIDLNIYTCAHFLTRARYEYNMINMQLFE